MMRRYGLGLTVWNPLASGFLTGLDLVPFDKEHGFELVNPMRTIAQARSCSVAQVAIAWLFSHLTADGIKTLDAATTHQPVYPNWFAKRTADQSTATALG